PLFEAGSCALHTTAAKHATAAPKPRRTVVRLAIGILPGSPCKETLYARAEDVSPPTRNRAEPLSVAFLLVYAVQQRLAVDEAADIFLDRADHTLLVVVGTSRDVWRDDHVVEFPQRVFLRQRLGIGHIHAGPIETLAVERLHQSVHGVKAASADGDEIGV